LNSFIDMMVGRTGAVRGEELWLPYEAFRSFVSLSFSPTVFRFFGGISTGCHPAGERKSASLHELKKTSYPDRTAHAVADVE